MSTLTKRDIIERLASRFPRMNDHHFRQVINETLAAIGDHLVDGGRVELRGLGTFRPYSQRTRSGHLNGHKIRSKRVALVRFRVSKLLKRRMK